MPLNIAINGLGRIGRAVLRLALTQRADEVTVVRLNDIAAPDLIAYLLEYDSVFGALPGEVKVDGATLILNGTRIPLTNHADPAALDYSDVDLLLDCTGKATSRTWAEAALAAGAPKVLISGPCTDADLTLVLGANDAALTDHRIVSNASCTTNALAPLLRVIDDAWGLDSGQMTTIHCYTGSQPTVDAPRGDFARSRAAALSMIPTTTSAAPLTELVLPGLGARVTCHSVRVPTASVSAIDLVVKTERLVTVEEANAHFAATAGPILGVTDRPLVSSDLRARPESLVIALPETSQSGGLLRVFGWYDNEWGFSNRMLDVAARMGA